LQYIILSDFVAIGLTIVEIWQFMTIFKMAAVRHFQFYKFEVLSIDRVLCIMPNFTAIGQAFAEI